VVIQKAPPLFKRNPDLKLFLATDASFAGWSYMVYQFNHITKRNEILKFNSRSNKNHEKNYGISKFELSATVFALKK
jgi:hypothetical protein